MINNILLGNGGDISTYKEYPIKGYEILSMMFFLLYTVFGFGALFVTLHDNDRGAE